MSIDKVLLKANFNRVCKHYDIPQTDVDVMKECVMQDMEAACDCFALLAKEIAPVRMPVDPRCVPVSVMHFAKPEKVKGRRA